MDRKDKRRASGRPQEEDEVRSGKKRRPESGEESRRRRSSSAGRKRRKGAKGRGGAEQRAAQAQNYKKRKKKRTALNIVSTVVLVAAICVFVFSLYQLVMTLVPYYTGGQEYDKIRDLFEEPSMINYPVVKSSDNSDYLTKTFVANDNKLGAIFMDYRNTSDFSDRNTFIYGHHLNVGGEMFSELLEYEDESFCQEHPNFYIYTPDGRVRTYTIFSAGIVKDTAENYNITYDSDEAFTKYLDLCRESSNYQVDVDLNAQSKIVSLSTCTNVRDDERFLVQGVLTEEVGGE